MPFDPQVLEQSDQPVKRGFKSQNTEHSGNFMIVPALRFYVKSILWILEMQKLMFLPF